MLLAIGAVIVPAGSGIGWGALPSREPDGLAVVLALGQSLPLAVRRRWPALGLAVVAGAFCGYQMMGYPPTVASVGLLIALYSVGAHQPRAPACPGGGRHRRVSGGERRDAWERFA